ncbi:MAG: glycosyltransferase family 4 protein [Muribaculaceae bacterium]
MNIIHLVSNKVWGGGEQYVLDLCRRLDADGHSVAVITRGIEAVDAPFRKAGFTPGHLPLGGVFDFISSSRLSRVLDNMSEPVVVHVHNFKDARTAVRARQMMRKPGAVRVVVTRHLVKPGKTDRASASLYGAIDAIAFVSQTALDAFLSSNPKVGRAKLSVIHNAVVDCGEVVAADKQPGELRIVYAGRLAAEKGIEKLIEALPLFPQNAVLHIAGSGKANYEVALRRYASSVGVGDRIVWHGHLSNLAPLMASADMGVLPTLAIEAFGLVVLEFMRHGVPVIATNQGGPREIITDGVDGILVPPGDATAIADAVGRLAADKDLASRMAGAAKAKVEADFKYEQFYNKILRLYDCH